MKYWKKTGIISHVLVELHYNDNNHHTHVFKNYIMFYDHTYHVADIFSKTNVWWWGESADLSQNEISRYEHFKSKFSPDSEFGLFVVKYSTTI